MKLLFSLAQLLRWIDLGHIRATVPRIGKHTMEWSLPYTIQRLVVSSPFRLSQETYSTTFQINCDWSGPVSGTIEIRAINQYIHHIYGAQRESQRNINNSKKLPFGTYSSYPCMAMKFSTGDQRSKAISIISHNWSAVTATKTAGWHSSRWLHGFMQCLRSIFLTYVSSGFQFHAYSHIYMQLQKRWHPD